MGISFDGIKVPDRLEKMACGGTPLFDEGSMCSYRCDTCFATIGSIGQSQTCKDINDDAENRKREWEMLGGPKAKSKTKSELW